MFYMDSKERYEIVVNSEDNFRIDEYHIHCLYIYIYIFFFFF